MIPVMDLRRQVKSLQRVLDEKLLDVLHSGQYILGQEVENFESAFASYVGTKYAIGVGNGSDALIISLRACGIKPGDEVVTTAMSYIATAEAIKSVGAKPVFVDVTKDTYTIDINKIEEGITEKTRAVIPVHLYGQCCDMDAIKEIAKKHDLMVIEDAAQAAGAEYKGKKAGSLGDVACVSFFPTKNLGCAGDGGMILANDEALYRQCKSLRVHGSGLDGLYTYNRNFGLDDDVAFDFGGNLPKYYTFIDGYNSRLDAIQAAILSVKLPHIDEWNERRRDIARIYDERINNPVIKKPIVGSFNKHIYYVYAIATDRRDELRDYLKGEGIRTGVYFPIPMHKQWVFKDLGYERGDFPNAEYVADHTLVLPMFPELTNEEIETVINAVNAWRP